MVAVLVWRCCVARTRVTRAVECLSARALRRLPLGLRVVAAYPAWFPNNVACNSPASISHFEITSLELQRLWRMLKVQAIELHATFFCAGLEARPGPADTHWCSSRVLLSRALAGTLVGALSRQPVAHGSPTMSHVIPLRVFQTLKSRRWDCNVCGVSRKMTKLNYVRLWGRRLRASSSEPARQSQFSSAT